MSKYDWTNVPEWVNWIFTDQDGDVFGCDNKPCNADGFHGSPWLDRWELLDEEVDNCNWQDSLEERPK